jgi:pSer/pThr/pTyr-binding forkhead associated (FHA) protein
MAQVTLRVLHGADRGRIFSELPTPVTIGREEGNAIQLNDERISRFHLKLQEDNDKLVLTDLDSTNGTRVNGEEVHVRIIRHGDMIALGRSVLLVGSHADIDRRIVEVAARVSPQAEKRAKEMQGRLEAYAERESDVIADLGEARLPLLPSGPPGLPERLSPAQAAELAELLEYIQTLLREVAEAGVMRPGKETVEIDFAPWQGLLDLQASLAAMLRSIADPG